MRQRLITIRAQLLLLTASLLVAACVLAGLLLWQAYDQEHQAAERQLANTARALSLVVDREIGQARTLLDALAASARLRDGQFADFVARVHVAIPDRLRWTIVLDADGRQIANSALRPGEVPRNARLDAGTRGYKALPGGDHLWNLATDTATGQPVTAVARALTLRDGRRITLAVASPAATFLQLFREQQLSPRWTGSLIDNSYTIVARSRGNDHFTGRKPSSEMQQRIRRADHSVEPTRTLDGIASITAWNKSAITGWTLVVAVPRPELAAGARSSLTAGLLLGGLVLAFGALIAWRVAYHIATPVERLAQAARALGRGEEFAGAPSHLAEIDAVHRALEEAGASLRAREAELTTLNETLEHRVAERTRELAEATETLIQAQKMEAVGRLTGGIAHDFNNLLTAVLGNLELVARRIDDERMSRQIAAARSAAERGARLTGQLLAFARRQQMQTATLNINELVEGTTELLRSTLGGAVTVERVLADDVWPAEADATQLELVMLNLAINARDAMPTGGSILIRTGNVVLAPGQTTRAEEPDPGEYATITVADRGTGMPPEVLARAFEPFFTTKPVGQGTGLGLSQVLGVVKQLGGGISIDSKAGAGTTVTLYLPRSGKAPKVADETEAAVDQDLRGMRVLLVDDDPDVRGVTAAMLRELGCEVFEAADGHSAIDVATKEGAIDIAIVDFAMPGLNGVETAAALREAQPQLPVLLMSGFADIEILSRAWRGQLMSKPFTAGRLAARIGDTLHRHRPRSEPAEA